MTPLRSRDDLIAFATRHAPSNACATALKRDRVEVLGGFTAPGTLPKFLIRVTARFKKQWLIAVVVDEVNRRYGVEYPEEIQWRHWTGSTTGTRPLIDGDEPITYALKRVEAKRGK